MNKFLILLLSLCFVNVVQADDVVLSADTPELTAQDVQATLQANEEEFQKLHNGMSSEEFFKQVEAKKASNEASKSEMDIIHKVEHKVFPMPNCDDQTLYNQTRAYIDEYFEKIGNQGTLFRRRHYFVSHSLDKFIEEDVSAYKNEDKQEVANAIANIEVNYALSDDNIRLCKNTSENKYTKDIYLLVFPKDDGYIVQILNLIDRQKENNNDISFFYKN